MDSKKRLALIADDDPDCLEILGSYLDRLGYEVRQAESQVEAECLIQSLKPDVAFFDLMMEHADSGFVLAHVCRHEHPEIPIVLVTSVAAETGIRFSGQDSSPWIQADAILDKGIRFEQLERELNRLLPAKPELHHARTSRTDRGR